jgi:hypothetical protein
MRIRTPPGSGRLLPLLILLTLAGCGGSGGGGDDDATATERPALAAATADRLVARSDTIALKLAAGDECGAAHEADALAADAIAAVNAGEIPPVYQEELVARTQELVNAVNCPPPVVQPEQPQGDEDEDDEGQGRGKKKGKKKEKDDE